jgi:hypothetical protein
MAAKTWSAALGLAAWVGRDWAIDKHAITLKDIDSMQRERCELGNTREAIELWRRIWRSVLAADGSSIVFSDWLAPGGETAVRSQVGRSMA